MSSATINLVLVYIIAFTCGLGSVKLWRTGLYRKYPALLSLLVFFFIAQILAVSLRHEGATFVNRVWFVQQPISWLLSVWVVLEMYSLILEKYKGLATLGRWVQYAGFAISTFVSLLAMLPQIRQGVGPRLTIVKYYYSVERGVDCGMLVFLIVILAWLSRYPVPLSRNVLVHCSAYAILFFSNSVGVFAQLIFGWNVTGPMDRVLTGVFACCTLAWLTLLTPKGEEVRVTVPHFRPEEERRILNQLEALNQTLLHISCK